MVIIYYRERETVLKATSVDFLDQIPCEKLIWVDVNHPTTEEKDQVETFLDIDIQDRSKAAEIEFSSRYHEFEDMVIINSNFLVGSAGEFRSEIVSFIVKDKILVSYRSADIRSFAETVKKFKINRQSYADGFSFLISLFESRIDLDADILEELSHKITELSRQISYENRLDEGLLISLTKLQENCMFLRENIIDNQRVVSAMLRSEMFPETNSAKLRILIRDIGSLLDHTTFNFERLEFLQNTFLGRIDLQQNKIIKIFTVATVVFMPPTLIASLYGMNFKVMPELEWTLGYPFALTLMIGSSLVTLAIFRKKNWV